MPKSSAKPLHREVILGIDPGSLITGWGLIELIGTQLHHLAHGTIAASAAMASDLNEIISEALVLFKEGHAGVDFQFRPGTIPELELDREQIKRVLMNLLDNAVAAVQGRGAITLATNFDLERAVVTFEVSDNGCGFAPEMRTKIFEPYFSTKENGTGLGLTIVSQIVEDHRGYIRVRPNDPQGTRFTIELPAGINARVHMAAEDGFGLGRIVSVRARRFDSNRSGSPG